MIDCGPTVSLTHRNAPVSILCSLLTSLSPGITVIQEWAKHHRHTGMGQASQTYRNGPGILDIQEWARHHRHTGMDQAPQTYRNGPGITDIQEWAK